ncbi:Crp/Fnr family transcriptional regulator [Neobacillus sp. DY30]|uniref:Crp/Fnr family transcriptional regulator n=1 Tax=Neobacillus sp. DY30 TaxID=3047871 RepID=UPI0024BFC8C4|nr:Crp/Fnr family transcriptional regulator [Neobacillus sp. DY30]WHY00643.1 Crp/Fnr family transcriptional regulator [Neobacillus sp. DY30]
MNPVHALEEQPLGRVRELKMEDFLRKIVIFKDLSAKSIRLIAKRIQLLTVKKGVQVICENDVAKGVFFIQTGAVKLTKQDESGNEIIVCMKQKGDVFAEACLFSKTSELYPATATMLQDGQLFYLDKFELEKGLHEYPELAVQMIQYMSDSLREMTSTLRDLALLDVYAKTVKTLERLGNKFNTSSSRWNIEIPLTIQEFATIVGTTRESVSRVFSKLKKEGIIEMKSRKIIILDMCRLCALMNTAY